jgi:hypothetical protein
LTMELEYRRMARVRGIVLHSVSLVGTGRVLGSDNSQYNSNRLYRKSIRALTNEG